MREIFKKEKVNVLETISSKVPSIEPVRVKYLRGNGTELITPFKSYINILDPFQNNPGGIFPVKSLKSGRYNELDHRNTFEKVFGELNNLGENTSLYSLGSNSDYSEVTAGFLVDKPFTLDQVPFEFNLGHVPSYTKNYDGKGDTFYPLISVTNSLLNCSEVSFNLYRSICANGLLMGKIMGKRITFRHFGDVTNRFNEEVQKFMMSIFEKRFVDNIFDNYSKAVTTKEDFSKFLGENLGKRVEKEIETNEVFQLPKEFSAWVGLQVLTYYTSNKIKNRYRGLEALRIYNNQFNGGEVANV